MEITTVNQLIAAGAGLCGVLVGGAITATVNYRVENAKRRHEKESFEAGFIAEVDALLMIIEKRRYLDFFTEFLKMPEIVSGGSHAMLYALIPDNYAPFYQNNMSKVGLLGPDKSSKLIQFHQILTAIIQDFKPDSYVGKHGFEKGALEENLHLLEMAISLGNELTTRE